MINASQLYPGARVKIVDVFNTSPPSEVAKLGGKIVTIQRVEEDRIFAKELVGTYFVQEELECFEEDLIDYKVNAMEVL